MNVLSYFLNYPTWYIYIYIYIYMYIFDTYIYLIYMIPIYIYTLCIYILHITPYIYIHICTLYIYIQFYLHITLRWDTISNNFNTRVFDFKLIHPSSWIHMILISHYLPAPTHHNNYRPTFSKFFCESIEIQSTLSFFIATKVRPQPWKLSIFSRFSGCLMVA